MSQKKLFGTDGIRGRANSYPITGEVAFLLGRAVTHYFQNTRIRRKPLIVVGKDTRLSCYMIEQAFSAGVCAQGGEVILTGPLPTPGVAFVTKSMRADAGVMISASHNPYWDNGIKIFDARGFKLPDAVELELEEMVLHPESLPTKPSAELGNAKRLREVFGRYLVYCKSAFNEKFDMEGLKIALDCAHGAGYKVTPIIFQELGAEVIATGVKPNGQNINHECGSLYPQKLGQLVLEEKAHLGICLDGDADRLIVIDERGEVVGGDLLMGLFAKLLRDQKSLKKGDVVVGTVMSNLGLELYLKGLGLDFERTQVGDRYIMEAMKKRGAILGGEPSGHIIFGKHATTGDGALAALKVVEAMLYYGKPVSQLVEEINLFPQVLKNTQVKKKPPLDKIGPLQKAIKEAQEKMGEKGRIVLRYSGTEPKVRVMVEGENRELVFQTGDELLALLGELPELH